jgi:hypothetical protein
VNKNAYNLGYADGLRQGRAELARYRKAVENVERRMWNECYVIDMLIRYKQEYKRIKKENKND